MSECNTSWELVEIIEEIRSMMQQMRVQIIHIFREANRLANNIANEATDEMALKQLQHFN